MKKALDILKEMKLQEFQKKHPDFPANAVPQYQYSDRTANSLTKSIIDFINLSGGQAERISNTGRCLVGKTRIDFHSGRESGGVKWIPGTGTNGTADISATIAGRSCKIEVKIGRDKQSEAQRRYQQQVEQAGGIYFIARSFDQFYNWYHKTFKNE